MRYIEIVRSLFREAHPQLDGSNLADPAGLLESDHPDLQDLFLLNQTLAFFSKGRDLLPLRERRHVTPDVKQSSKHKTAHGAEIPSIGGAFHVLS